MAILTSSQVKMTSLLEKTVAIIAPHRCIICSNYNNIVCDSCITTLPGIARSFCVFCGVESVGWRPCGKCTLVTALSRVYVGGMYEGVIKDLIHRFKFEHARDAYKPLAAIITTSLPNLTGWTVVPVPTVAAHIRERSYDHTLLIAKQVARVLNLPLERPLARSKNVRQVGADRTSRAAIAESIELARLPKAAKILLIDDVCTTGATLNACALLLKQAGVTEVRGVVAAWQPNSNTKKDR
jgi:ComF family protein